MKIATINPGEAHNFLNSLTDSRLVEGVTKVIYGMDGQHPVVCIRTADGWSKVILGKDETARKVA